MSKLIKKDDFRDNCGFGLIANINGNKSHEIITKSIDALKSMTHRGAIGADGKTGDGCGLLVDLDKNFFIDILFKEQNIKITDEFAIGQIFTDKKIESDLPKIKKILEEEGIDTKTIIIPSGEKSKSFSGLESLIQELLIYKIERNDTLIALGGGVVGDLVGFASSIIYRGINFIQIPTTILSQVDSSVGGKTGINMMEGKNLVGSFHQPRAVISDVSLLRTLPKREIVAGYAEIIKYAILGDRDFFNWLKTNQEEILNLNNDFVVRAVEKSCLMKAKIVEEDEKENGKRAVLNLGHTFGHALEKKINSDGKGILHGEAIALGMCLASELSYKMELCSIESKEKIIEIATLITDSNLNIISEGPNLIISQPKEVLDEMDDWNQNQHGSTGLIDEVMKSDITEQVAEIETLEFVSKYVGEKASPMCGNTVSHDRRFLSKYMPRLEAYFNYRHIDAVSYTHLTLPTNREV